MKVMFLAGHVIDAFTCSDADIALYDASSEHRSKLLDDHAEQNEPDDQRKYGRLAHIGSRVTCREKLDHIH